MTTEIVAYSATETAVADLALKYKDVVFAVTTQNGMMQAKSAYRDINTHSLTLEAARVKEKAESLAYGRKVDSEAKRIAEQLDALRLPIKAQIETETKREERERQAAIKAEEERILVEQAAAKAKEEKHMAEQRAEIARQQAELDRQQRERLAEELSARRKIEEEQRAARAIIEAEERTARLAREEADRQANLARQAREEVARIKAAEEAATLKAERDKIEAERRALEEAQRKEREAAEAKQHESARLVNELNDGYEMLATFVRRFGKREEFKKVTAAIGPYLRAPV